MERFWMTTRGLEPNDAGAWVRYADAQRALDAERERVAKLEKIQAIDLKNNNEYRQQLATLQAQLRQVEEERDALKLVNETHMKTVMKLSSIIEKSSTLAHDAGKGA